MVSIWKHAKVRSTRVSVEMESPRVKVCYYAFVVFENRTKTATSNFFCIFTRRKISVFRQGTRKSLKTQCFRRIEQIQKCILQYCRFRCLFLIRDQVLCLINHSLSQKNLQTCHILKQNQVLVVILAERTTNNLELWFITHFMEIKLTFILSNLRDFC